MKLPEIVDLVSVLNDIDGYREFDFSVEENGVSVAVGNTVYFFALGENAGGRADGVMIADIERKLCSLIKSLEIAREETSVSGEMRSYINGKTSAYEHIKIFIAELKKEYTEGKNDDR